MANAASDLPAYILAGGQSKRFGSDKSRVNVEGQMLVERLVEQVAATGRTVRVVADQRDRFSDLGMSCLSDVQADSGPMAGLITALEHRQLSYGPGRLVLLSCDLVFWDESWIETLGRSSAGDCVVSAYSRVQGSVAVPQPMPAIYNTDLLAAATQALHSDARSLVSMIGRNGWNDAGPSPCAKWSFNTQQELAEALLSLRAGHTKT